MNLFTFLTIRAKNSTKQEIIRQSKRKICCETCRYCYLHSVLNGYSFYKCLLKEVGFDGNEVEILKYKCENYNPCRKYKKYLDSLKK